MNFIPLNRPDIRSHDFAALEGALQALAEDDYSPIRQLESAAARLTDRPYAVAATTAPDGTRLPVRKHTRFMASHPLLLTFLTPLPLPLARSRGYPSPAGLRSRTPG